MINGKFDREHRRRSVATRDDGENQNAVVTGENGEIRIFGRGSNRSNNSPYEYFVVMRPMNGEAGEERTVGKLGNWSKDGPAKPLVNWFVDQPKGAPRENNEERKYRDETSQIMNFSKVENLLNGEKSRYSILVLSIF